MPEWGRGGLCAEEGFCLPAGSNSCKMVANDLTLGRFCAIISMHRSAIRQPCAWPRLAATGRGRFIGECPNLSSSTPRNAIRQASSALIGIYLLSKVKRNRDKHARQQIGCSANLAIERRYGTEGTSFPRRLGLSGSIANFSQKSQDHSGRRPRREFVGGSSGPIWTNPAIYYTYLIAFVKGGAGHFPVILEQRCDPRWD